jgi:hypothetical protein
VRLPFPRAMLDIGIVGLSFEPERVDFLAPEAGGQLGAMTAGFPRWVMRASYGNLKDETADALRAWVAVQRGGQRPFVAWDITREQPLFHAEGRPYNHAPTSWSQAVGDDGLAVITLGGLLSGQTVGVGDYIGLSWNGLPLALARAVEPQRAGAAGTLSVAVEPPLPPVVPANATVSLRRAGCLMRLVPGETKLSEYGLSGYGAGAVVVAAQDLIR